MAKLKPYTNYKDSGVDWLGEIPEGWKVNRTKVLFKPIDERSKDGSEQLLSVSEHVGVKPRNQLKITMFQAESYEGYKLCQKGDLVINSLWAWKRGLGFSEYSGIVSTAYGVYRPKKSASIDYKFFHYLYRTKKYVDQLYIASRGIWKSRMQLSDSSFLNILVAYPEFETQVKARKYLEYKEKDIDKYIKKLKKEIALLKEHRQKVISQAVTCGLDENGKLRKKPEWNEGNPIPQGWKDSGVEWLGLIPDGWVIRKLKYISKINREALPESTSAEFNIDYVDISSVNRTKGIIKTEAFQFSKAPSRARRIVHDGDVIVSTVRTYLKAIAGIENPPPNLIVSTGFAVLTPDFRQINSRYFKYSLIGDYFVDNVVRNSVGVSYPAINTTRLGNIIVIFPNLKNQIAISKYLDEHLELIDKQVEEIENQIEIIKEYKQSLISKVVTGKIDVRNINNNLSED